MVCLKLIPQKDSPVNELDTSISLVLDLENLKIGDFGDISVTYHDFPTIFETTKMLFALWDRWYSKMVRSWTFGFSYLDRTIQVASEMV